MGFHLFTFSCVKVLVCSSVVFLSFVSESVDVKVFGRLGVVELWGLGLLGFWGVWRFWGGLHIGYAMDNEKCNA